MPMLEQIVSILTNMTLTAAIDFIDSEFKIASAHFIAVFSRVRTIIVRSRARVREHKHFARVSKDTIVRSVLTTVNTAISIETGKRLRENNYYRQIPYR